ncbi:hypothetical protein EVJ58_g10714 [Rhodofomes roseus]|uniref:Uncharacterized protein n=1 Tax=Rhodofomes roseus TaxID=34475 RepID=A0A4Y9XM52_9APHY|nr:hypothetical protein EVJ58_g10714 [Rhodofomes roseus]
MQGGSSHPAPVVLDESAERGSPAQISYVDAAGDQDAAETDRLLPTTPESAPLAIPDVTEHQATSDEKKGIMSRFSERLRAIPSTVPTVHVPGLQQMTFDYPFLQRLGRVRLPEDEEAVRDRQPTAPSRFANCWTAIKKRQFRIRWWHYVLLVLVILAATIPPIVVTAVRHARRHSYRPTPAYQRRCGNPVQLSLRLDEPFYRQGRQEYLHAASASFGVPADTRLELNAFASHGNVRFVLDNSTDPASGCGDQSRRNITIDVTAYMDDWNAFRPSVEVCRGAPWGFTRNTGLHVGFAGGQWHSSMRTAFDVTVRLPAGSTSHPVRLGSVSGNLQDFEVSIDDLQGLAVFDDFSLFVMNMPIHAESLVAAKGIKLRTMNAPISGTFIAPRIDLNANNGEINANASLVANATVSGVTNGWHYNNLYLMMQSTNRAITANVGLVKPAGMRIDPVLPIDIRTNNAPIDLTVAAGSNLTVSTHTTFAPTTVKLPGTYTGDFSLNTWSGWQQPVVHFDREHDERTMQVTSLTDRGVSGNVRLPGSSPRPYVTFSPRGSRVTMSSQNGDLDLYL